MRFCQGFSDIDHISGIPTGDEQCGVSFDING